MIRCSRLLVITISFFVLPFSTFVEAQLNNPNDVNAPAPMGPAPTVDAEDIGNSPERFHGPAQDAVLTPSRHPPIDSIPPMPMPDPSVLRPITSDPVDPRNIIYDATTGEETIFDPPESVNDPLGDLPGAVRGYEGPDASASPPEWLATFSDMIHIGKPGSFPWRMNVKLVMNFSGSFFVCSGTMVDPETVFTAGHCVYDYRGTGWATEIWVYPGWEGGVANPDAEFYGEARGTQFLSTTGWTNNGNFDWDLGAVRVTRAAGSLTGWFGYAWDGSCAWHTGQIYHNASYPSESCPIGGLHNGRDLYYWSGFFDSCPGNQLQIDTFGGCFNAGWGGMSGSGMYYIDDTSTRYVHATASNSNRSTVFRSARLTGTWVTDPGGLIDFISGSRGASFDLQALNMDGSTTAVRAGYSLSGLTHRAANPTNGSDSDSYYFDVYLSTNDNISEFDTRLGTQTYSRSFTPLDAPVINMAAVPIPASTPPGNYWIGVLYDCTTDSNCGNNDTDDWDALAISVQPGDPDLIVVSPAVSSAVVETGAGFTAYATVENIGGGTSNSTILRYYWSTNSVISAFDTQLGTDFVSSLTPSQTSPENQGLNAPAVSGTYWIGACVDSVAGESDTSNNCSNGVRLIVQDPPSNEINLTVGTPDTNHYGHNHGTNQHRDRLVANFTTDGSSDLTLSVTGYDIDYADEVSVYLNGTQLGFLTSGPNNGHNSGDTFDLLAAQLQNGNNQIEFRQRVSGWTWGVSDILVDNGGRCPTLELCLTVGVTDTGHYGNNHGSNQHLASLFANFSTDGSSNMRLSMTGYDIDYSDEVSVLLNGIPLGYLSAGPNNAHNSGDSIVLPAAQLFNGDNRIEFRQRVPGWTWGVSDILVEIGGGGGCPVLELCLTVGTTETGQYGWNYGTGLHQTSLVANFTTDGSSDMELNVSGYDIDYADEVSLYLNGNLLDNLSVGPNNGHNGGDTFTLPAAQLNNGNNQIVFQQRVSGWTWGVTDILLSNPGGGCPPLEVCLTIGVTDVSHYGNGHGSNQHVDDLVANFMTDGASDLVLRVIGYDIDFGDEISVHLNGNQIGHLSVGPNNGHNTGDSFTLPAARLHNGNNQVRFEQRVSGWIWGVSNLLVQ